MRSGILVAPGPTGRQNALQVRPRRGNDELSGIARQGRQHLFGVVLAGRLAGDNDGSRLNGRFFNARFAVFLVHNGLDGFGVNDRIRLQGRKVDGGAIDDFPVRDGQIRHGKG